MMRVIVGASLIIGTVVRVLPLLDPHGRALRQFASEDGYLMLTIARNLAIGNGFAVEDGLTPTNGTQPLMTLLYAGLFWLVDGNKVAGVVGAQALGIGIGLVGAWLLYRVGSILLRDHPDAHLLAAVAASAWYVAPIGARYTQNCLETGAAAALPMAVGLWFLRSCPGPAQPWSLARCAVLGLLLGVGFLVRNDQVLLSAAVCLVVLLAGFRGGEVSLIQRLLEASCVGTTALLVALPWLAFNQASFGHVVPVSGISQGADIPFADNLTQIPSILAEQISVVALIPGAWETQPLVLALCSVLIVAWSMGVFSLARGAPGVQRQWLVAWSIWATFVVAFYGLIYGAGYFMGRYLYVLSPWMALFSVALVHRLWVCVVRPSPRVAPAAAFGLVLLLALGLHVRAHRRGGNNGHFQAVEWIARNVPDDVWVGAIQTGTVGFFHDRSYNLDGKVSPPALQARLEDRIFEYVLQRPIEYLVDWVGIAAWAEDERLAGDFELLLDDEQRNLAVLRRTTPFERTSK